MLCRASIDDSNNLALGYGDWLESMRHGATEQFSAGLRRPGGEVEVGSLRPGGGRVYPPPWTSESKDLAVVSRRVLPLTELVAVHEKARRDLDGPRPAP